MASGRHMLEQQKANVATSLKRLINQDLKEICRNYGKAVSGNKADLQQRCLQSKRISLGLCLKTGSRSWPKKLC